MSSQISGRNASSHSKTTTRLSFLTPYVELARFTSLGGITAFSTPYLIGLLYSVLIVSSDDNIKAPSVSTVFSAAPVILLWSIIHRGAVCTINDIFDLEFDLQVARTRSRALPRGAISVRAAWIWYFAQCILAAVVANFLPHAQDAKPHAVYIVAGLSVYPLAKRWTDFPQISLGAVLGWGVVMSCVAVGVDPWKTESKMATCCLIGSQAVYFVGLDYTNACQDTEDDVKAGVGGMAVRYRSTGWFLGIWGVLVVSLLCGVGVLLDVGPGFFVLGCGGNAILLMRWATAVDRERKDICSWWFRKGTSLVGSMTIAAFLMECLKRLQDGKIAYV